MKYTACFRVLLARDKHLEWGNNLLHISLLNGVILDSRGSKALEQNHVLIPRAPRLKNQGTDESEKFWRNYYI